MSDKLIGTLALVAGGVVLWLVAENNKSQIRRAISNTQQGQPSEIIPISLPKIPEKTTPWEAFSNIPEGMNKDLLKVFAKYRLGLKSRFSDLRQVLVFNINSRD